MSEIVRVPFHGEEILTAEVDGQPHIILKPAIEGLGLDYWAQVEKLKKRSWAALGSRQVQVSDQGQRREMLTCDVRTFTMLLATVDENRVGVDVRPKLIAYQAEVADAIESYWTKGGAINPRATTEQVVSLVEAQMRVLQMATGLVDARWLEAKTRHAVARALGEEPEVEHDKRPLTVGEYLADKGVKGAALRSQSSGFGKRLKALYRDKHGQEPPVVPRFVDGAMRDVAGYTEYDRPLFDEVFSKPHGTASRGA